MRFYDIAEAQWLAQGAILELVVSEEYVPFLFFFRRPVRIIESFRVKYVGGGYNALVILRLVSLSSGQEKEIKVGRRHKFTFYVEEEI